MNNYYHSHDETISSAADCGVSFCLFLLTNQIKPLLVHKSDGGIDEGVPKKRKYTKGAPRKRRHKIDNNEVIL